jgi:hypothetical protein
MDGAPDGAAGFLVEPLGDMVLIGGFFALGIHFHRRREWHRRLMILASVALVYPTAARLAGPLGLGVGAVLATWLLPLAGILLHEGITRRRIHPVDLVGTGILVLAFGRIWVGET